MKARAVDVQRAVVAHDQSAEIAEPGGGALNDRTSPISPQLAPILCGRTNPPLSMGTNQLDAATPQAFSQRITVVRLVSDSPHRLMPRTSGAMSPSYADRRQHFFREPDFRRGGSVKVVSQRNILAVVHHHPLRPLPRLAFPTPAPLFRWSKTAVQKRLAPVQLPPKGPGGAPRVISLTLEGRHRKDGRRR